MNIENIYIGDDTPEDIVQFIKDLEENLDPQDEYDCSVYIESIKHSEIEDELKRLGIEIPLGEVEESGVKISFEFDTIESSPTSRVSELASKFFKANEYILRGHLNSTEGVYEEFVFLKAGISDFIWTEV